MEPQNEVRRGWCGTLTELVGFLPNPSATMLLLAGFSVLGALLPLVSAHAVKTAIDSLTAGELPVLRKAVVLMASAGAIAAINGGLAEYVRENVLETLARQLRDELVETVLAMPLLSAERKKRGDLVSALTADAAAAAALFGEIYWSCGAILRIATAVAYIIYLNAPVGLACIAAALLSAGPGILFAGPVSRVTRKFREALGEMASRALNIIEGIPVIKAFNAENWAGDTFEKIAGRVCALGSKTGFHQALSIAWSATSSFLPVTVAFSYGGYLTVRGQMQAGSIVALLAVINDLEGPLRSLGRGLGEIGRSAGALRRVLALAGEPPEHLSQPAGIQPAAALPRPGIQETRASDLLAIRVERLSFSYDGEQYVLKDISFQARPGQFVAIVGRSGCGKTTLLKVLSGLYRVPPGSVFILGNDAGLTPPGVLRKAVAYVPQDSFLLPGTIRENLELGKPGATDNELMNALEVAHALDVVSGDPGGLERTVGERGEALSGGERQRLCIARTVLRDAPILLLDEPTSSLDRDSEARVRRALLDAMRGKTAVLVTHRLDMAARADAILVMESGRIVERGTHGELMAAPSLYRSFWASGRARGIEEGEPWRTGEFWCDNAGN